MNQAHKKAILNKLCEFFIEERKVVDLIRILVYLSRRDNLPGGKESIWKMLNSLVRHSKAFNMYALKLSSISNSLIDQEKCLSDLQNFLNGQENSSNSMITEEFELLWSLLSQEQRSCIIHETLPNQSLIPAVVPEISNTAVVLVKESIKSLNEGTIEMLGNAKLIASNYIAEPLVTHAMDVGGAVIGFTTGSYVNKGDPFMGAALGIVLCYVFRTSFVPRFMSFFLINKNPELKRAYDLLGVLPTTQESIVTHVYRRLKRESINPAHMKKLEEAYDLIIKHRKSIARPKVGAVKSGNVPEINTEEDQLIESDIVHSL